jgi:hypothetical protein
MSKNENIEEIGFDAIIEGSKKFQDLKLECRKAVGISVTGITNIVVNYEDPGLVDDFLKNCFSRSELYKETFDLDAVELQQGMPGRGVAAQYIDTLIYGSVKEEETGEKGLEVKSPKMHPQTGKRERKPDGFVSRKEVQTGLNEKDEPIKDRLLVIKNLDYCLDFCQVAPGKIDARNLWIFDNFRNPNIKLNCRILLITNEPIQFPFSVRRLQFDPVDAYEASNIITSFSQLCQKKYTVNINESQKQQIIRKLCGLTYTEAADALGESMSKEIISGNTAIEGINVVKTLREKINANLMANASGLTHLRSKPWNDYICPENSNFTYDVKKIVRDFDEINTLREKEKEMIKNGKDSSIVAQTMESIRARMPHVMVLYGKGGVGKSAYPIHFAGLLDFDVWDFNINASHSKWVGEGPERMREALKKISKASHVVVRIDEYDRAMGSTEGSGQGMHEAHKQVESEFMNWLQNSQEDNLFAKNDIFVVMTTNHKENITGPLLRSGRADLVIDINEFDDNSIRQTYLSASRRMKNRGVALPLGFDSFESLHKAIEKLDLDKIVPITSQAGFTVRDVDTLLIEMASHNYYFKKNNSGIPWTTEMFVKVLEGSSGSTKSENTSELVLGDRFVEDKQSKTQDNQCEFGFAKDYSNKFDLTEFTKVDFFK